MAEQTIQIKVEVDKGGNIQLKSLEKGFENIKLTAKQAGQAAKQLGVDISQIKSTGNIDVAANSFNKLSRSIAGASAASGGATASVLEVGRVISDMPYGIRGVANNLQQLASNFAFMAKEAGSAFGALKAMGSALMGPLGVLVAFQAVIAAIDYFSAQTNKAEKDVKSMNETIAAAASNFKILLRAQEDNTLGLEEAKESVRRINSQYKDLNVQLDENGRLTDASVQAIETKIQRLEDLAKATAIQTIVEEKYGEVILKTLEIEQLNVKLNQKIAEATALRAKADKDREEGAVSRENRVEQMALSAEKSVDFVVNQLKELTSERGAMEDEISKIISLIPNIGDLFRMKNKSGFGGAKASLKQQLLDLSKIILDAARKEEMILEENEIEKMNIRQRYEREDIKRRRDVFLQRQKKRYDDFMKKAKTDEQRAEADRVWEATQVQAKEQYEQAITAVTIKHTAERHVKMLELERKFAEELVNSRLAQAEANQGRLDALRAGTGAGRLNRPMSAVGAEDVEGQNEAVRARMEAEQQNFEDDLQRKIKNLTDAGHSLLEAERMVQGERHAFQMSQAEQEIELERNKIEAKRQINLEYASWAQGLGDIFAGIAGENEALATAALILQKGSAIANVIVDTQAANAKITSNMLAEQAAFNASAAATSLVAPPLSAGFKAMAVKAGVLGKTRILKNNIGAGLSIAKIAATTLQSRSAGGSTGGGGAAGGGAPSREFDFNLVGSTGVNQLAQGVGSQFNQNPIQAYVVSSQMTSQQQLDHTIQTQASLGD
jgi:hypothetical protein